MLTPPSRGGEKSIKDYKIELCGRQPTTRFDVLVSSFLLFITFCLLHESFNPRLSFPVIVYSEYMPVLNCFILDNLKLFWGEKLHAKGEKKRVTFC